MSMKHLRAVWLATLVALIHVPLSWGQAEAAPSQPATQAETQAGRGRGGGGPPPADLRALLATPRSEMALVMQRYETDRTSLSRFYEIPMSRNLLVGRGGGRGAGGVVAGNGGADGAAGNNSISFDMTRIARLKRFDRDWAEALDRIDGAKLSPAARDDLQKLKASLQANGAQLDAEVAMAHPLEALLPFAANIIKLEEARRRMETMDAERAAVTLAQTVKEIAAVRARMEAGMADESKLGDISLTRDVVTRAAAVTEGLQTTVKDWCGFYNDYDPMFTWWMAQPSKEVDGALADYAAFLRNKVLPAAKDSKAVPQAVVVDAAAAPAWSDVPDLQELLAFPQNELIPVMQRFGGGGGRGFGRGGGGRSAAQSQEWLTALQQLDFDKLSRNAQIDYLHMRNNLQVAIRRANTPPQENIPRKMDNEMLNGQRLVPPVGRQALMMGLAEEMVPYTPEELLSLAEHEFAWCDSELKRAAREMGLGEDEKKAMETAKNDHVPPGKQPDMIRDIIRDDVAFLRSHELITVPEIDYETLRMEMMSPQRQLVNPYFTGGALISVSYPVSAMTTQQKLESMRGNNHSFALATVHHELIPGHNLQAYLTPRFSGIRGGSLGSTPFYGEGWAVYWEMTFYDLGFPKKPEDRLGFLFWRMMRCGRIVFSLKYHLGEWSGHQCVDYLVERVLSERENATAEVTRSFNGSYPPLYQAGYLLGAIEFRQLHKELVESGQMTNRQFHDAVLQQPSMPVMLVRLALNKQKLAADMPLDWKFYGPLEAK